LIQRTDNRPNVLFDGEKAAFITIHETANKAPTATAESHASWLFRVGGATYSWHYTVDDKPLIYQSLRETEQGWHAGDGSGPGNTSSIGIELCVCDGQDFSLTLDNAAELVAMLNEQGHGLMGTVPHQHWSGKNCPTQILANDLWDPFLKSVAQNRKSKNLPTLPDTPKAEAAPPIVRPIPPPPAPPPAPNLNPQTYQQQRNPTLVPLVQGNRTIKKAVPEIGATGGTGGVMALLNSLGVNVDIEVLIAVMVAVPPLLFAARRLIRDALNTIKELRSSFSIP
tara:strand:- start:731 stop:1576 length:846 start_codon:yes stop_codon:yes gene_type:complete